MRSKNISLLSEAEVEALGLGPKSDDQKLTINEWLSSVLPSEEQRSEKMHDPVNHPEHYQQEGIETIDYIRAALGLDGFVAYCAGNIIKYASRPKKGKYAQDLRKAAWYCAKAAEELDKAGRP